jgi:hypothetical protein
VIFQSSIYRLREGEFTDADVGIFLMRVRELDGFPILTEIGHLVAHSSRDRGEATDSLLVHHARLSMTALLLGYGKEVKIYGECPWFLKRYLVSQVDVARPGEIRRKLGTNKDSLKKEINSWFEQGVKNPDRFKSVAIDKTHEVFSRRKDVLKTLSGTLKTEKPNFFNFEKAKNEAFKLFCMFGLDVQNVNEFLICCAILFHRIKFLTDGKSVGISILRFERTLDVYMSISMRSIEPVIRSDTTFLINMFSWPVDWKSIVGDDFFRLSHIALQQEEFGYFFSSTSSPKLQIKHLEPLT